jgi:hypothetical protein
MNGTISQINNIIMLCSYKTIPDTPAERTISEDRRFNERTSSKYTV